MEVLVATNGRQAIDIIKATPGLAMVLMDIMMPEMDGYQTMREIRKIPEFRTLPILALTAKAMKGDREKCLEAGASDYIAKPVKPRVFLSRIKALLRRQNNVPETAIEMGELLIDNERFVVVKKGEEINLPKKEFELVALLASKPGKVFTRNEILNRVWGNDVVVGDRTIDVHIRKVREKLGEDYIRTVKGVGYKFEL